MSTQQEQTAADPYAELTAAWEAGRRIRILDSNGYRTKWHQKGVDPDLVWKYSEVCYEIEPLPADKFTPEPTPSGKMSDKLAASLQQGDVALVLTRPDLATLTALVEKSWRTDDEFKILGNLKKLMEARR